jgi:tetratricopeptide (TPR) repeat protein
MDGRLASFVAIIVAIAAALGSAMADDGTDLAACRSTAQQPNASLPVCTTAIRSGRLTAAKKASAYTYRGIGYARLRQFQQAIADFDAAIGLDPNAALAVNGRGLVYLPLNQHQRAIADFDRALAIDPNLVAAYGNRGLVNERLGRTQAAIRDHQAALRLNRGYAASRTALERLGG